MKLARHHEGMTVGPDEVDRRVTAAETEEIAGFCRFVLSDAGSYITGAILNIDGGRTL